MKKRILLLFLSALLFAGCGSKVDTENAGSALEESESLEGHIAPIDNTLIVEACETLSLDPAEYLTIGDGVDPAKIELHFDAVDPTVCEKYSVSASYGDETVHFNIRIIDRTAPEITIKEDIPVFCTHQLIDSEDLVEVKDISHVYTMFDVTESRLYTPEEPGEYVLKLIAKDSSGNRNATTVTITVEPLTLAPDQSATEQIRQDDTLPQAFKDFLLGDGTAVIGDEVDFNKIYFDPFDDPLLPGQTVTLQDICAMINKGSLYVDDDAFFLTTVKYGILDCGMDHKPDLALQFYFAMPGDSVIMTTVLHEENGKVMLNSADAVNGRSWSELYQDGYYIAGGSGGASSHGFDHYILDETGTLKDIYVCSATFFGNTENLEYDTYFIDGKEYKSYFINPEASDAEKQEALDYISSTDPNGIVYYSDEEIQKLIRKRMDDLGFSAWDRNWDEKDLVEFYPLLSSQLSEKYEHHYDRMHYYSNN